jgi:hypothetical protein
LVLFAFSFIRKNAFFLLINYKNFKVNNFYENVFNEILVFVVVVVVVSSRRKLIKK